MFQAVITQIALTYILIVFFDEALKAFKKLSPLMIIVAASISAALGLVIAYNFQSFQTIIDNGPSWVETILAIMVSIEMLRRQSAERKLKDIADTEQNLNDIAEARRRAGYKDNNIRSIGY